LPPQSEQPETTTINVPGRDYLLKRKLVIEKFKPVQLPGDITVDRWLSIFYLLKLPFLFLFYRFKGYLMKNLHQ
jgi:hypothetical protein